MFPLTESPSARAKGQLDHHIRMCSAPREIAVGASPPVLSALQHERGPVLDESDLIARGVGKWAADSDVPKRGWRCERMIDLGPRDEGRHQKCQMCECVRIRYVHVMAHHDWPTPLRSGCVCAGHMEHNRAAAYAREEHITKASRRVASRRKSMDADLNARLDIDVRADTAVKRLDALRVVGEKRLAAARVDAKAYDCYLPEVAVHEDHLRGLGRDLAQAREHKERRIAREAKLSEERAARQRKLAKARDKALVAAQREEFADPDSGWWQPTRKGNTRFKAEGFVFVAVKRGRKWKIRFAHQDVEDWKDTKLFPDLRTARLSVYDQLIKRRAKRGVTAPLDEPSPIDRASGHDRPPAARRSVSALETFDDFERRWMEHTGRWSPFLSGGQNSARRVT